VDVVGGKGQARADARGMPTAIEICESKVSWRSLVNSPLLPVLGKFSTRQRAMDEKSEARNKMSWWGGEERPKGP